jgi:DNA-binding transcriptional ArsR family regulator
MSREAERLHRYMTQQVEDCCEADVEARIETLQGYQSEVEGTLEGDRSALKTLGNGTRYRIARLLVAADEELCVCEITPAVDVSDSAISHALSDLHDAGLVTRRKEGRWRHYAATPRTEALLAALDGTRGDDR